MSVFRSRVPSIFTSYVKGINVMVCKRRSLGLGGNQHLFAITGSKTYMSD